jgi:hypothetical protein
LHRRRLWPIGAAFVGFRLILRCAFGRGKKRSRFQRSLWPAAKRLNWIPRPILR